MSKLTEQHCAPCEGGVEPLTRDEAQHFLDQITSEWQLHDNASAIRKAFKFKGFYKTMGFVNAVAWIANSEGHHPDLEVGYGYCNITFSTHSIGGLSENDFICAAKIDALLKSD